MSGPEVHMEPWVGATDENRGIEQRKGSIAAKMNSWTCSSSEYELFGYMAFLWPCVKAGRSHHACELTEK